MSDDGLNDLRRTTRRMRYWLVPLGGAAIALVAPKAPAAQLPGLLISAAMLGASWTVAGWVEVEP